MPNHAHPSAGAIHRLIIVSDSEVRTFALVGDRWTVGRGKECCLVLGDKSISRKHMLVERTDSGFRFEDLGGLNSVIVNGRVVQEGVWTPGQTLVLGTTRITLDRQGNGEDGNGSGNGLGDYESGQTTYIHRDEIDQAEPSQRLDPNDVTRFLRSLELAETELSSPADLAEPLLQMAMNLTGHRRGLLGMFSGVADLNILATVDRTGQGRELRLPPPLLQRALASKAPFRDSMPGAPNLLLLPLGPGPAGLLVLADGWNEAGSTTTSLQIARLVSRHVWQRLEETAHRASLRSELERQRQRNVTAYVCASERYARLREQLHELAATVAPTLLVGEPGCDIEVLARYLHSIGPRAECGFAVIEASQLLAAAASADVVATLLETGHGRLQRCRGGTLYLGQPDRLPPPAQQQLAECIATGKCRHWGRTIELDVRFVAGTAADPQPPGSSWSPALAAVFGRPLAVPPLRSSQRDIPLLAELVLMELPPLADGRPRVLQEAARQVLNACAWPGNEQQLRAALTVAAEQAGTAPIEVEHLPVEIRAAAAAATPPAPTSSPTTVESLADMEKRHIVAVLQLLKGNKTRTASALGIAASTLYEKIKRYNLDV